MTVEEIFTQLASHMIEGIMYHDAFANAYAFLGLYGHAKCHDNHHIAETCSYRKLQEYYSTRFHKILRIDKLPQPQIIPEVWYKYTTMAVDANTRRSSIKDLMEKWVEWERTTKLLYQQMYQELCAINEVAAAQHIKHYIKDVDKELAEAEKELIHMTAIGYDIVEIMSWQDKIYKKEGCKWQQS